MSFLSSKDIIDEILLQQEYPLKLNTNMSSTTANLHLVDLAYTQMDEGKWKLHTFKWLGQESLAIPPTNLILFLGQLQAIYHQFFSWPQE